jgi:hypothetical protein
MRSRGLSITALSRCAVSTPFASIAAKSVSASSVSTAQRETHATLLGDSTSRKAHSRDCSCSRCSAASSNVLTL